MRFAASIVMVAVSVLLAKPLASVFAGNNEALLNMSVRAIRIFSICYLFSEVNTFASSFFTALNNGLISAIISFMRVLVLQVVFVMTLPMFFHLDGIWMSIVLAELCAVIITAVCMIKNRARYHYA